MNATIYCLLVTLTLTYTITYFIEAVNTNTKVQTYGMDQASDVNNAVNVSTQMELEA